MKPWRCQICGETYLGKNASDRCPYCGADGKNLMSSAEYLDYSVIEMSQQSKEDCEKALQLEMINTSFYKKCADNAGNQVFKSIFKRLGKQESEHAELLADMMGIEEGDFPEVDIPDSDSKKFVEAHDHEQKAINFYMKVARRAPEKRVQQVFRALSDIEQSHLNMSNMYK